MGQLSSRCRGSARALLQARHRSQGGLDIPEVHALLLQFPSARAPSLRAGKWRLTMPVMLRRGGHDFAHLLGRQQGPAVPCRSWLSATLARCVRRVRRRRSRGVRGVPTGAGFQFQDAYVQRRVLSLGARTCASAGSVSQRFAASGVGAASAAPLYASCMVSPLGHDPTVRGS
jgi:hypothetical protein